MITREEFLERFNKILSECDLTYIRCICLAGSYSLPFIENPHDIDIHCFVKKEWAGKFREPVLPIRLKAREEIGDFVSVVPHWEDEYTGENAVRLFSDITDFVHQRCSLRTYVYEFIPEYCPSIYGDAQEVLGGIDILGKDKEDYLKNLKWELTSQSFLKQMEKTNRTRRLYHVLCGIYFIENNSYELTEEQKKNVNIAHDKTDGWEGLYEWAKEEIERLCSE
jgi:hypothetical protein